MARPRLYIQPFDRNGARLLNDDLSDNFIPVTKYIKKLGAVGVDVDSNDYQLGIYKQSSFSFEANNRDGIFSDVDILQSIFRYKRGDSIVRVTWTKSNDGPYCGFFTCGEAFLADEVTVFEGLLSDDVGSQDAKSETIKFSVLGFEDLFNRIAVGMVGDATFDSLTIGDTVAQTIFKILNQSTVTDLLTLDIANIVPAANEALDSVDVFSGKTGAEAVNELLQVSNSILYIKNRTIYVQDRTPSVTLKKTFYGQASQLGVENIIEAKNDKTGVARIYNYFTWKDFPTIISKSNSSVTKFGVRAQVIDSTLFTNATKQTNILDSYIAEFSGKKREFEVTTQLDYDTLALWLKDKINADYPIPYFPPTGGGTLPICGIAVLGVDKLPKGKFFFKIRPTENYKIIGIHHDLDKQQSTFKVRKV